MEAARLWLLLALALPLLLPPAPAQGSFEEGSHHVADALVVGPGDTFVLGPGASLTGPGSLEVWGRLEVRGAPGEPALVAIPIRLLGDHAHHVSHARLWGVNGTALLLANGSLRLDDVAFDANRVGLEATGPVLAQGRNVTFRAHAGAGLSVGPLARVDLEDARFEDNDVGARVAPGASLRLAHAEAKGNRVHVLADLAAPDAAGPRLLLLDPDFGATGAGGSAGILARAAAGSDATSEEPGLQVEGGRLHDSPVALQASGAGLRLRVEGATLEGNGVGLALSGVAAELKDVRLGNGRDIDGGETARLLLQNVTYLPKAQALAQAPAPASSWPAWVPWLAMAGVLFVAAAILWTARPAPARPAPAAPPPEPSAAAEAGAFDEPIPVQGPPASPALVDLGAQERRILEDIVAHPDTAQAAVAERLGLSRQAVHYHVKKLEGKGLIRKTAKGRETQCRAEPDATAALARPPVPGEG